MQLLPEIPESPTWVHLQLVVRLHLSHSLRKGTKYQWSQTCISLLPFISTEGRASGSAGMLSTGSKSRRTIRLPKVAVLSRSSLGRWCPPCKCCVESFRLGIKKSILLRFLLGTLGRWLVLEKQCYLKRKVSVDESILPVSENKLM